MTGGGAFSFDPWNLYSRTSYTATPSGPRLLSNGNVIVIGAPGNGKSALVKTLCFRLACFGRRVEAIDPKGEYGPLDARARRRRASGSSPAARER